MTFFSFLTLLLLSIVFSLPIWSFLFCLILSGPKVSNTFILISLVLSIFFNILDLIDLELEFFFFIFLFIYISAIVVLFLFAFLILPINTNMQINSQTKTANKPGQNTYFESFELIIICLFWSIFENIDQLVENYLDLLLEYSLIKYSHMYFNDGVLSDITWITIAQLNQNILVGQYIQHMQVHALSWFFLEKYFLVIIAVISILLTTIFGTIHWLRKTEVIEY